MTKKKAPDPRPTRGLAEGSIKGRGPNAPRLGPKDVHWFKPREHDFTPQFLAMQEDLGVCYDLVSLASYILNRPIKLIVGGLESGIVRAATDGKIIYLPKLHPQRRIAVKHELSHLYFKSNIPLRLLFVHDMVRNIEQDTMRPFPRERLISDLCFVINIFDDLRVNSLWGLLYPGDGMDMDSWYLGDVAPRMMETARKDFLNGDISHLFTYIILIALGQPAESSEWGEFKQDIERAADSVIFKTFNACLLIVKDLVLRIARKLADRLQDGELFQDTQGDSGSSPDKNQTGSKSLRKAFEHLEVAHQAGLKFSDDNAGFDFDRDPTFGTPGLQEDMQELEELESEPLQDVLQELEIEATTELAELHRSLQSASRRNSEAPRSDENYLTKDIKSRVDFVAVKESDLVGVRLGLADTAVIRDWRIFFSHIMSTQTAKMDEIGSEIVPELYIQQRLSSEPLNCFRVDTSGRGFRVNLCIDLSGSMDRHYLEVERLTKVLTQALDFPFVTLNVWGFNSKRAGEVSVYKFPRNPGGLASYNTKAAGQTPLPQALQIIGKDLLSQQDTAHLLVISDGVPQYTLDSAINMSEKALVNLTREAVNRLAEHRVQTTCFMIGNASLPSETMDRMFGLDKWQKVAGEELMQKAFNLVAAQFTHYLRTR